MKKLVKIICTFSCAFLVINPAYPASLPTSKQTTFLGPTLRLGFTSLLTDTSAYSYAGELGPKNARISGTFGWNIFDNHNLKFSAEYLWQNLNYSFFAGNTNQAQYQGAVGADYRYALSPFSPYHPQFGINAYYSNAATNTLSSVVGTFVNTAGVTTPFLNVQRIAGSNAIGVSPGFAIQAWQGGQTGFDLNYDKVRYTSIYGGANSVSGFGGTLHVNQSLTKQVGLGLSAAVRKPYNNYQADIAWSKIPYFGMWTLKLFGGYTVGKSALPSTYNAGLSADYFLDMECNPPSQQELMAWIATPAVHMPQVLAIPDEQIIM